jgi:2-polyprenyl-6-methoxyphenol hydroxylase-like FAD-dependent oxidoreductase
LSDVKSKKIAICGAGPAGLTIALFLHRAGHDVEIIERFDEPAPVGSGLILQPTGLSVLAALGLLGRILSLGHRIDRLHGTDAKSGRTVLDVRYASGPLDRFGFAVQRTALFNTLHETVLADGITIRSASTVNGVRQIAEGAMLLTDAGEERGPYDLVVDATGARSQLVSQVFPDERPKELVYGAFWATLVASGFHYEPHALLQRYERAEIMIGVLPIGRVDVAAPDKVAFFWSQKSGDVERVKAAGIEAWKATVLSYWPELQPLLVQLSSFDDLVFARYQHRTLRRPAAGRLVFIGDAAHCTSPQLGQGANMALLDAAALAYSLAQAPDVKAAIDLYCRARRNHVRLFQSLSLLFTPFYQSDSRLVALVRDQLVATVANIPPLPRLLASIVSGTLIDPLPRIGIRECNWRDRAAEMAPIGQVAPVVGNFSREN